MVISEHIKQENNIFSENVCFYDVHEYIVVDHGSSLGPTITWSGSVDFYAGKHFHDCHEECDRNPKCNNIKMCDNGCTLYTKILLKNEPASSGPNPKNCFTLFKTCPGGKN